MANSMYDPGREGFLDGSIIWSSGDIRAMLVLSSYTFSAAHKFVSDLGAVDNGRTATFASKTVTNGVADAADINIVATAATASKAIVFFQHTGVDSTARLIAYDDTVASGLPFTPAAGQTVNLTFDNGANKIFKL